MSTPRIFYFHDFKEKGLSPAKKYSLKKTLPNIIIKDIVFDYDKVDVKEIEQQLNMFKPDLIIGSGYGGKLAFYYSNKYKTPAILYNPAFNIKDPLNLNIDKGEFLHNKIYFLGQKNKVSPIKDTIKFLQSRNLFDPKNLLIHTEGDHLTTGNMLEAGFKRFLDNTKPIPIEKEEKSPLLNQMSKKDKDVIKRDFNVEEDGFFKW